MKKSLFTYYASRFSYYGLSSWVWRVLYCAIYIITDSRHPEGKPAGVRCVQFSVDNLCRLYNDPRRPVVCEQFTAAVDMCGASQAEALQLLSQLERQTRS